MFRINAALLAATVIMLSAVVDAGHYDKSSGRCHTKSPSQEESLETEIAKHKKKRERMTRSASRLCKQCITIDTYFVIFLPDDNFVPTDTQNRYSVTEADADKQFEVLVNAYSDTPFTFNLKGVQFVTNNQYYMDFENTQEAIGKTYRQGGWDTLNCYFGAADKGSFAFFPKLRSVEDQNIVEVLDGAFNDISTMPGVDTSEGACCTLGFTAVHEVGHWLGLHHTFDINSETAGISSDQIVDGCNPINVNDYVDDTPQQKSETDFVCPETRDSCPNLPGQDPIHNYMDYSSDDCYTE